MPVYSPYPLEAVKPRSIPQGTLMIRLYARAKKSDHSCISFRLRFQEVTPGVALHNRVPYFVGQGHFHNRVISFRFLLRPCSE